MISFKKFITEQKNTHMTHIEDKVLYGGVNGTRDAINALRSLRDMLAGVDKGNVSVNGTAHLLYLQEQTQRTESSSWVPNPYLTQRLK